MSYCLRYSSDYDALSNCSEIFYIFFLLMTCLLRSGRFSFFFFYHLSVQFGDELARPGKCYGYISPGLPVGATHLLSGEILDLAARPASDSGWQRSLHQLTLWATVVWSDYCVLLDIFEILILLHLFFGYYCGWYCILGRALHLDQFPHFSPTTRMVSTDTLR